ncbi:MAG: hypothetical protein V4685_06450 [Bacteroidota bacterium]
MTRSLTLLLILICGFIQPSKAQINFSIEEPYYQSGIGTPDNIITDSTFYALVHINSSTFEIASVKAVAEDSIFTLLYDNAWGSFRGKINISGYTQGVKRQLKVIVRDIIGNEKIDSIGYTYAKKPTSKILLPLAFSNGYPSLPIKVNITGVDSLWARIEVSFNSPTTTIAFLDTFFIPGGVIDTTINVNNSLFGYGSVKVTVWDKFGQGNAYNTVDIFADGGLFITPYYTGNGKIIDFNYNKILELKDSYLYHIDSSRQATQLPGSNYTSNPSGKLTIFGALYFGNDWTPDSIYHDGGGSANVAGKYKTNFWSYFDGGGDHSAVNLVDMETRTTTLLDDGPVLESGGSYSTVAENGLVVFYHGPTSGFSKYKNGVRTPIGTNITGQCYYPITDGEYVLYQKNESAYRFKLCLHNGVMDTVLSTIESLQGPSSTPLPSPTYYELVNKTAAYVKPGTSGQSQIWLWDSLGNNTQVTFFGNSSLIQAINPSGDLVFNRYDGSTSKLYYLKRGNLVPRDLGPVSYGKIVYRDSAWYKIEGRYIYKLNPEANITVANGNWTNPASWEGGTVPLPNADVIVTTNIIVDTNVICNTLKVVPPGSITVLPGVNVTVLQ